MVEPGTVRKLLEVIEKRLLRLEGVAGISFEDYQSDPGIQDRVERNFEVVIQACIDLGLHILADRPVPVPETNRAVFSTLVDEGLVDAELGRSLENMAGFRNLLAHGYADLVPKQVHGSLSRLPGIRSYIQQISRYLEGQGALPRLHD